MGTPHLKGRATGAAARHAGLLLAARRHRMRGDDPVGAGARPTAASRHEPVKEVAWAEMDKEQRIDYMKSVVLPRMKQVVHPVQPGSLLAR